MPATIRMHGPNGILATLKDGVWTSEVEGLARLLNSEMKIWKWERPNIYDLEQDKTDALHMIEKFGQGNAELVEFIPNPSNPDHTPDSVY